MICMVHRETKVSKRKSTTYLLLFLMEFFNNCTFLQCEMQIENL